MVEKYKKSRLQGAVIKINLEKAYNLTILWLYFCVGVAVALAARDILKHMLGGLSLHISKLFSVGDYIKVS